MGAAALEAAIRRDLTRDPHLREVYDPRSVEFPYAEDPVPLLRGTAAEIFERRARLDRLAWALRDQLAAATDPSEAAGIRAALHRVKGARDEAHRRLVGVRHG